MQVNISEYITMSYQIHPVHAAAMFNVYLLTYNRMRGLEGKYARNYVNRNVT